MKLAEASTAATWHSWRPPHHGITIRIGAAREVRLFAVSISVNPAGFTGAFVIRGGLVDYKGFSSVLTDIKFPHFGVLWACGKVYPALALACWRHVKSCRQAYVLVLLLCAYCPSSPYLSRVAVCLLSLQSLS